MPQMEQQLFAAVSSTSSWLDGVENNVFSGSVLLADNAETQLQEQEVWLPSQTVQLNLMCLYDLFTCPAERLIFSNCP